MTSQERRALRLAIDRRKRELLGDDVPRPFREEHLVRDARPRQPAVGVLGQIVVMEQEDAAYQTVGVRFGR